MGLFIVLSGTAHLAYAVCMCVAALSYESPELCSQCGAVQAQHGREPWSGNRVRNQEHTYSHDLQEWAENGHSDWCSSQVNPRADTGEIHRLEKLDSNEHSNCAVDEFFFWMISGEEGVDACKVLFITLEGKRCPLTWETSLRSYKFCATCNSVHSC